MSQIQIYARVRPTSRQFDGIKVHPEDSTLAIHIGEQDNITKRPESRYARAPPSKHMFKFRHVFDQQASQEEVFNRVATHMIDSFLTGYVICNAKKKIWIVDSLKRGHPLNNEQVVIPTSYIVSKNSASNQHISKSV